MDEDEVEEEDLEVVPAVAASVSFFGLLCRLCVEVLELELSESEEYLRLLAALAACFSRFPLVPGLRSEGDGRGVAAPNVGDRMLSIENLRFFWCSWCRWWRRATWSR